MKPKGTRHLSDVEKDFIKEKYPDLRVEDIAKQIKRPPSTIRKFASKEKLKRKTHYWSASEIKTLKNSLKNNVPITEIVTRLNRSYYSVYYKIRKMKQQGYKL